MTQLRSMTYSINCKTKWENYLCRGTLEFKRLSLSNINLTSFYNSLFNKCCSNGNSTEIFWLISRKS